METPSQCPKCGGSAAAALAAGSCPTCGLLVSNWTTFDGSVPSLPPLDAALDTLRARWDDESAHDTFLAVARSLDALDLAAAHYRVHLRSHPDDARARRGLERAVQIATKLQSVAPRGELLVGVRAVQVLGVVVAGALLAALSAMLYGMLRH